MDASVLAAAPPRLLTSRLRLEGAGPAHAAAFVESLNASLATLRFIAWAQKPRDLEWAERFCRHDVEWVGRLEGLVYYAYELADGGYVGRVDLHSWDWEAPRCEVGYVGDVRRAGRGLMREAVRACVELAFALGAVRVQALSEIDNQRALHFAEHALGFVREGVLRHYERDAQGRLGLQVMFASFPAGAV